MKWKTNQSTKLNLIGCDTIVNSPSFELFLVVGWVVATSEIANPKARARVGIIITLNYKIIINE
jgi:hypothetical protein